MGDIQHEIQTCAELLELYLAMANPTQPERIMFSGVGELDVYNITAQFEDEGDQIIAGRVESRDSESSKIVFFLQGSDGVWAPREGSPTFTLQDPFFTRIGGELIVGGVQTYPHPTIPNALKWRTVFYKGSNIANLQPFFTGPDGMKDLRIVELQEGSIAVFTRPQGEKGGRGKIGYVRVASIDALSNEMIEQAPLLTGQFIDDEWGGANELHVLNDGRIGVLGHIACFDAEHNSHYYPMSFILDPSNESHTPIRLIAQRSDFIPGAFKHKRISDVVFSGGLVRQHDGTAVLYAGISDAEAHMLIIPDPFS